MFDSQQVVDSFFELRRTEAVEVEKLQLVSRSFRFQVIEVDPLTGDAVDSTEEEVRDDGNGDEENDDGN